MMTAARSTSSPARSRQLLRCRHAPRDPMLRTQLEAGLFGLSGSRGNTGLSSRGSHTKHRRPQQQQLLFILQALIRADFCHWSIADLPRAAAGMSAIAQNRRWRFMARRDTCCGFAEDRGSSHPDNETTKAAISASIGRATWRSREPANRLSSMGPVRPPARWCLASCRMTGFALHLMRCSAFTRLGVPGFSDCRSHQ